MDSLALLIDFGSTYTKVVAVDLGSAEVIGRSQSASTVNTDVRDGLLGALLKLQQANGIFRKRPQSLDVLEDSVTLASSSAAGGLKMVVVGLVPGLTVEAANAAALGAGAKLVGSWGFKLNAKSAAEIEERSPDMILLTGGTDGGDSATILHNARTIAGLRLTAPVVVAGNGSVQNEVCGILAAAGKDVRPAENVMPKPGKLAVESAREEIRKLFMERITHAKGLENLNGVVPVVLPTPMAVLQGALLASQGTDAEKGLGDLLVVDVGGATTDVHSIGFGQLTGPQIVEQGLPEPFAKRTVEGDLGIRFNAATLLERVSPGRFEVEFRAGFPQIAVSRGEILDYIASVGSQTSRVPEREWQSAVDAQLARLAVDFAIERHVGKRERIVSREGEAWVYYGKDLSETRTLIGTGGVFIYNPHARYILSSGPGGDHRYDVLRPKNPDFFVDSSYLLYAVGLLSEKYPDVAARVFHKNMGRV